ncbi:hypothetical protein GJ689_19125 [Rhodoplanes serenus]|uniref:LacI family transcriptional regulator n=1 Tax=Rhodoplanes serenus TaxID=200615 RepID=A0A9X5AT87_9BRAD|nr:hypothetical protein [Rhodoplanes serenus]MTW18317.1 hypothetical protein [Rhodoplanes serenus]
MAKGAVLHDADSLTVTVPMTFTKRGGRKLVLAPNGVDARAMPRARVDSTMVKALARAHRWKRMLDSGDYPTVQDLANAEEINSSYVARVLRLSLLAPAIVEAILDGRQPPELQLEDLLARLPVEWSLQHEMLRGQR